MTNNPLEDIENRKAQFDMGIMAARIYEGAKSESKHWWDAYIATCAFFTGMLHGPTEPTDEETP